MSAYLIRAATPGDGSQIRDLIYDAADRFMAPSFSEGGVATLKADFTAEKIAERIAGDFRFFVADVSGQVMGVIALRGAQHLYALYVHRDWHGQGLASRLWRHACGVLRETAVTEVTVNASVYALPIYLHFGFETTADIQDWQGVRFYPMLCRLPEDTP